jgi:hypothetical protein
MASPAATAYRVVLGVILRSYRERTGLTPRQVAQTLDWYGVGKVSKVEAGTVRLTEDELDRLLRLFEISGAEADKLREFGASARERTSPTAKPAWSDTYKVVEAQASEIKAYEETLVHGLAQTHDYASALLSVSLTSPPSEQERKAAERIKRQRLLTATNAPQFWLVVAEPVLLRPIGGRAVLRDQLRHLRELSTLPNVTFQVIPLGKGEHSGLGVSFTLLHLALPIFTFAYLEHLTGANYLDHPDITRAYTLAFDRLRVTALDDRDSVKFLDRRIKEIK